MQRMGRPIDGSGMVNEWLTAVKIPNRPRVLQVAEQAGHVDHAGGGKSHDQHHVHLTLPRIASEA